MLAHAVLVATIYHIEGNFDDGKIWQMQHMNICGGIKFGKLVKPACAPACLHTFIIQSNIQSYCNLWMKGVKLAW